MQEPRVLSHRGARLAWIVGLAIVLLGLEPGGPALAAEELFRAMAVQRLANPSPAPDLAFPNPEGKTVHLKDFRGKVVLLGFFTTD
jgi:cytochrome oxidase Cu insertion factor (SCO1/SenC/PrrC family)